MSTSYVVNGRRLKQLLNVNIEDNVRRELQSNGEFKHNKSNRGREAQELEMACTRNQQLRWRTIRLIIKWDSRIYINLHILKKGFWRHLPFSMKRAEQLGPASARKKRKSAFLAALRMSPFHGNPGP
jgi:hypothetical protein